MTLALHSFLYLVTGLERVGVDFKSNYILQLLICNSTTLDVRCG